MINKPPPFKGLDIMIPAIIPMKGRGLLITGLGYGSKRVTRSVYKIPKMLTKYRDGPVWGTILGAVVDFGV